MTRPAPVSCPHLELWPAGTAYLTGTHQLHKSEEKATTPPHSAPRPKTTWQTLKAQEGKPMVLASPDSARQDCPRYCSFTPCFKASLERY